MAGLCSTLDLRVGSSLLYFSCFGEVFIQMYPNRSIEPRMSGTGYARLTSDTDTAPFRADEGYEERGLLYSAAGDSTCQQEMEILDVARLHVKWH
jgi:hypothetical protein